MKRSLNEATPPPQGLPSSLPWRTLGAENRSGLACASTGIGLNNGDAAGDEVDLFAEREGGGNTLVGKVTRQSSLVWMVQKVDQQFKSSPVQAAQTCS